MHTWTTLPRRDKVLVVQASVLFPLVATLNRLIGFKRVQRALEATSARGRRSTRTNEALDAPRTTSIVEATGRRLPWGVNCLQRSMVLCWGLRRRGFDPTLRFGVRPPSVDDTMPSFHAWVELDGTVLNDRADIASNFLPFDVPPQSGTWS